MAERALGTTGVVLLLAYVLAAGLLFAKPDGRVVFGDATHHFVQLRSLVYDRDLDFRNEFVRLYRLERAAPGSEWIFTELTPTGRVRNYMPVGPALLWAPLYMLMSAVQLVASWLGLARAPDGFDRVLQMAPGITGVVAATLAALLAFRAARALTDDTAASAGVFGAWLGSHALYYTLVSPSYSHAASMFTAALFFGSWIGTRERLSMARFAVWGALAGLAALMRWQDAIFLVVPLIEAARWQVPLRRRAVAGAVAVLAFVVVFSPQMAVWTVLYGRPLALPQGPSFMQWTSPHLWAVLVSDKHGLFTWAPMLIPACIGLVLVMMRHPAWRLPVGAVVLLAWYVNAAVADWWAGEAFGARRFLSLFPLFVIGLAFWVGRSAPGSNGRRARIALVAVLGALNWLLLLQYQIFMRGLRDLAPYPEGLDLWLTRFVVPFRLIERWLS